MPAEVQTSESNSYKKRGRESIDQFSNDGAFSCHNVRNKKCHVASTKACTIADAKMDPLLRHVHP
jgi:hypothetical protein